MTMGMQQANPSTAMGFGQMMTPQPMAQPQQAPMIPMGQGWQGGSGTLGPTGMGTIGTNGGGHVQMGIGSNGGTTNFTGGGFGQMPQGPQFPFMGGGFGPQINNMGGRGGCGHM